MTLDPDTLHYPVELVDAVVLNKNQISFLKKRGCPFFGKKTTLRWVRDFIARAAGAQPSPSPDEHPRDSTASRSCGQISSSGSPAS